MSLYVKLSVDWRGSQRGEVIEVADKTGKALIRENIADLHEKEKTKNEKPIKVKQIQRASHDKMLRGAPKNKIIKK
ncbi:MAG TPA: hypothetical protein VMV86_06205 [Methanosarcinales archaeon]|nr:hypothetical protein [Methanosarcinales archaeon]